MAPDSQKRHNVASTIVITVQKDELSAAARHVQR